MDKTKPEYPREELLGVCVFVFFVGFFVWLVVF